MWKQIWQDGEGLLNIIYEMTAALLHALKNCNNISLHRKAGEPFKEEISISLELTVSLLKPAYDSYSVEDIQEFWEVLQSVDTLLTRKDTRHYQ